MSCVRLHKGDARNVLSGFIERGLHVDSVVTDPPYGFDSIIKRFGKEGAAAAKGGDGRHSRLSAGFMGKNWDGTQIERDPEFWNLVLRVLKPGGFCFAFSGARSGHWQAVAMEQAGFVIHPMHAWLYSQGFPKAHDAAKHVERKGGNAKAWEGWVFSTQSQKPALEPIYLAQRPISEKTFAENLIQHGAGAVNIDACRGNGDRWPANVLHDNSDAVRDLLGDAAEFFNSFPRAIYSPKAGQNDRAGSNHPTVKPIALLRHLVRHITPPGGVVLDPFAGSGTTGEAANKEGFECHLIEREDEYFEFLEHRFAQCVPARRRSIADLLDDSPVTAPREDRVAELLA
jgi:site-specific DNA-methyltransferase (adenine-specific)